MTAEDVLGLDCEALGCQESVQAIRDGIHEHVNPPAALRSGHRGLPDKASAEVHKWAMQVPPTVSLHSHAATYISHSGDMVVEMGLADFHVDGDVSRLLPRWFSGDDSVPAELDLARSQSPAAADGDDLDGPFLDDIGSGDERGQRAQDRPEHLLENALTIPGFQHIISKLSNDVHASLSHWVFFWDQLNALEAFLRMDERRQRFVWTCVRNTNYAGHEHKFLRFKGSLYEQRWHEVVAFLGHVLPLLPILARAWDEAKYVRGVDEEGQARQGLNQVQQRQSEAVGLRSFELGRLAELLNSSLFQLYAHMVSLIEKVPDALARESEACLCHRELLEG